MSFQDVARRRFHPIFDNHRQASQPNVNQDEVENPVRIINVTKVNKQKKQKPQKEQKPQRGVRPRLTTKCPVTSKPLTLATAASSSSASETVATQDSHGDSLWSELDRGPTVRLSPMSSKEHSVFSQLNSEIVNFQKMVAELDLLIGGAGLSPEAQWRTRILIRSAQDADRDICQRLYAYDEVCMTSKNTSRAQVATRKLHRDFQRVHKQLQQALMAYEKRQQVEVSFLSAEENKEEFFERAMREREEEVNKIHKSMEKVNEIYTDLAAMVEGQQEQIDKLGEHAETAKANTKSGFKHIQNGMLGWCGPLEDDTDSKVRNNLRKDGYRVEEEFKWTMPFETIGADMKAVHDDMVTFGRNLKAMWDTKLHEKLLLQPCQPVWQD